MQYQQKPSIQIRRSRKGRYPPARSKAATSGAISRATKVAKKAVPETSWLGDPCDARIVPPDGS
jgi:hypothetical protein